MYRLQVSVGFFYRPTKHVLRVLNFQGAVLGDIFLKNFIFFISKNRDKKGGKCWQSLGGQV